MRVFVGQTDNSWFNFLANRRDIVEVNFWQPSGANVFRALKPGEPFLFKLKAPYRVIAGGGFFVHSTLLPLSLAWESFGEKNGVASFKALSDRISAYRKGKGPPQTDPVIGCILLQDPFFLPQSHWVPAPAAFDRGGIVAGKAYSDDTLEGRELWESVSAQIHFGYRTLAVAETDRPDPLDVRFAETIAKRRLGQSTFRVVVTDAYERRCAVSRERTLPVLQAAHVRPVTEGGTHALSNGLLLRSDIHTLFDRGYVTVEPDLTICVRDRLRADYDNGKIYYQHDKTKLWVPPNPAMQPSREQLEWHADTKFLG